MINYSKNEKMSTNPSGEENAATARRSDRFDDEDARILATGGDTHTLKSIDVARGDAKFGNDIKVRAEKSGRSRDIFIQSVLSRQFVTSRKMIHSLPWRQRPQTVRTQMSPRPKYIEVLAVRARLKTFFCESASEKMCKTRVVIVQSQ